MNVEQLCRCVSCCMYASRRGILDNCYRYCVWRIYTLSWNAFADMAANLRRRQVQRQKRMIFGRFWEAKRLLGSLDALRRTAPPKTGA